MANEFTGEINVLGFDRIPYRLVTRIGTTSMLTVERDGKTCGRMNTLDDDQATLLVDFLPTRVGEPFTERDAYPYMGSGGSQGERVSRALHNNDTGLIPFFTRSQGEGVLWQTDATTHTLGLAVPQKLTPPAATKIEQNPPPKRLTVEEDALLSALMKTAVTEYRNLDDVTRLIAAALDKPPDQIRNAIDKLAIRLHTLLPVPAFDLIERGSAGGTTTDVWFNPKLLVPAPGHVPAADDALPHKPIELVRYTSEATVRQDVPWSLSDSNGKLIVQSQSFPLHEHAAKLIGCLRKLQGFAQMWDIMTAFDDGQQVDRREIRFYVWANGVFDSLNQIVPGVIIDNNGKTGLRNHHTRYALNYTGNEGGTWEPLRQYVPGIGDNRIPVASPNISLFAQEVTLVSPAPTQRTRRRRRISST